MNIALILSGGTGSRAGLDIPKQYAEAGGRPIFVYCVMCLSQHEEIDGIRIVASDEWRSLITEWLERTGAMGKFRGFSDPGENRQLSILQGLKDMEGSAGENDRVLIHDAARPMLSKKLVSDCLSAIEGHDGVLPVLPMKDTVYLSENGSRVSALLDRNTVFAGQAPEVFRFGKYYRANQVLLPERIHRINGSTEPAILAGMDVVMIDGEESNSKITTRADLERFRQKTDLWNASLQKGGNQ